MAQIGCFIIYTNSSGRSFFKLGYAHAYVALPGGLLWEHMYHGETILWRHNIQICSLYKINAMGSERDDERFDIVLLPANYMCYKQNTEWYNKV